MRSPDQTFFPGVLWGRAYTLFLACVVGGQNVAGGEIVLPSVGNHEGVKSVETRFPVGSRAGAQRQATSGSFHVRSRDPRHPADQIALVAEELRSALEERWLGRVAPAWQPPCEIVVHGTEWDYLREVGWQAAPSQGACRVGRKGGQIACRRIDLFADPHSGSLAALAHELTHAIVADRFPAIRPPRWLDEGLALQADSVDKQIRHLRDLGRTLERGRCSRLGEVLEQTSYPHEADCAGFYGQSLSLVNYLATLARPAKMLDVAVLARKDGYDRALQEVYGIAGIADLESSWLAYAAPSKMSPKVELPTMWVGFTDRRDGPWPLSRLLAP